MCFFILNLRTGVLICDKKHSEHTEQITRTSQTWHLLVSTLYCRVFHNKTSGEKRLMRTLPGRSEDVWEIAIAHTHWTVVNSDDKGNGRKGICFQLWYKNLDKGYSKSGDHPLGGKPVLCCLVITNALWIQGSGLLYAGNSTGLCCADTKKSKKIWNFVYGQSFLPYPVNFKMDTPSLYKLL